MTISQAAPRVRVAGSPTLVISQNSCGVYTGTGNDFCHAAQGVEEAYGVGLLSNSANASYGDITPAFHGRSMRRRRAPARSAALGDQQCGRQPARRGQRRLRTCNGGANTTTTSSTTTNYSFTNVAVGTNYSLTFSDAGFTTQIVNSVAVTSGNTTMGERRHGGVHGHAACYSGCGVRGHRRRSSRFCLRPRPPRRVAAVLAVSTEFDGGSGKSSGSVVSVTDNQNDTWTRATAVNPSTRIGSEIWYAPSAAAGVTSVTVTYSTTVNPVVRFYEISGASSLDKAASASGTSASPSSGLTGTTSTANEVVIGNIGFVTTTVTISGLSPGFTDDTLTRNPATNFNNSEQAGNQAVATAGTFSYAGTLSIAGLGGGGRHIHVDGAGR